MRRVGRSLRTIVETNWRNHLRIADRRSLRFLEWSDCITRGRDSEGPLPRHRFAGLVAVALHADPARRPTGYTVTLRKVGTRGPWWDDVAGLSAPESA